LPVNLFNNDEEQQEAPRRVMFVKTREEVLCCKHNVAVKKISDLQQIMIQDCEPVLRFDGGLQNIAGVERCDLWTPGRGCVTSAESTRCR
jgi:hypothetical protein